MLRPEQAINVTSNNATADTFSNIELYIPSYLASQHKPSSVFSVNENNATRGSYASYCKFVARYCRNRHY
jgi:hypothetical protein